jgi:hypothetical protein
MLALMSPEGLLQLDALSALFRAASLASSVSKSVFGWVTSTLQDWTSETLDRSAEQAQEPEAGTRSGFPS